MAGSFLQTNVPQSYPEDEEKRQFMFDSLLLHVAGGKPA
jgi:hypothetical protein